MSIPLSVRGTSLQMSYFNINCMHVQRTKLFWRVSELWVEHIATIRRPLGLTVSGHKMSVPKLTECSYPGPLVICPCPYEYAVYDQQMGSIKTPSYQHRNSIIKIIRSWDRLIFIMEMPRAGKTVLKCAVKIFVYKRLEIIWITCACKGLID